MRDVYIVEAVRSPIGRRRGDLATLHPGDLLDAVQKGALDRRGIDPTRIDQVIGGCVSQVGEQSFNIARCAWLSQGLPLEVPQTTVDSQCGSSQQATTLAMGLVGSGMADYAMAIGMDTAQGRPGDPLEYTAAAGGAAFIIGKAEDSLAEIEASYSFVTDTPDFWDVINTIFWED